jgi:osmotically-inducible protein OsmY
MKKLTLLLISTTLAVSTVSLSGCAVTTAGIKKGDERNFVRSLNDVTAGRAIKARMLRAADVDLKGVDVEVAQGIVLLSGNVRDPKFRIEAERIAWSAPNVTEIGNEIKVKDSQGFIRNAKDGVLNKAVKSRLIAEGSVKARNFNVETHDGTVYLLGIARTPEELERAAQIASTTRGAREVISYARVVDGTVPNTASYPQYEAPTVAAPSAQYAPQYTPPAQNQPQYRALPNALSATPTAPAPGEPIYRNPQTGEIIELAPGTKTIPYIPPTGSGPMVSTPGTALPSGEGLSPYRVGKPGETVSQIESAPYYVDPETGKEIPVSYIRNYPKN